MAWIMKGLREGIVTTRYPHAPDGYGASWRASVTRVTGAPRRAGDPRADDIVGNCPTQAISIEHGEACVDRGKCILCGRCVTARPDLFRFDPSVEIASLERNHLVVGALPENDLNLEIVSSELAKRTKALRRSVHIRHVDSGSDGSDEWEVAALTNPIYDVARLGIFFTASPRHADLLLITGAGVEGMREALALTIEATPEPRVIMAAGVDAVSGGMIAPEGGIGRLLPVDVWVPGSPPSPFSLLHGILIAVGILSVRTGAQRDGAEISQREQSDRGPSRDTHGER